MLRGRNSDLGLFPQRETQKQNGVKEKDEHRNASIGVHFLGRTRRVSSIKKWWDKGKLLSEQTLELRGPPVGMRTLK